MPVDLDISSTASGEARVSFFGNQTELSNPASTTKMKRNKPGMLDPKVEIIALSPKTLSATNRFVCEICNKGFQRDQNLQLHRRGHNLPWKLKQSSAKEVKKRVYVCPEPICIHHDPSKALGDLTGIKKHFFRKHGEKKWKCDKCSKKYAVQSDLKAHSKICGSREYKCVCGTLFSRRDSFITHRAYCDALAEESAMTHSQNEMTSQLEATVNLNQNSEEQETVTVNSLPQLAPPPIPSADSLASPQSTPVLPSLPAQNLELKRNPVQVLEVAQAMTDVNNSCSSSSSTTCLSSSVFASLFASSTTSENVQPCPTSPFTDLIRTLHRPALDFIGSSSSEPISLCLSTNFGSSIFGTGGEERRRYVPSLQPAISATALLQKAAQIGAAASNVSLLCGLGIVSSSSTEQQDNLRHNQSLVESDNSIIPAGLGLGLPCEDSSGLKEVMMGTPPVFGPKQITLDFLGLGDGCWWHPNVGLSPLVTPIGGCFDVATAAPFDVVSGKDIGRSS